MFDQLISMLMTFILLILSLFGGTGDINKPGDTDSDTDSVVAEYSYKIFDDYFEFKNIKYGEYDRNVLDLCVPRTNTKCEMGLILFIHGGSWVGGSKDEFSNVIKEYALANGYACAAINYRYLSDDVNMYDILDDISASLVAIKNASAQVAVTVDKALLTGGSAGAHLAMLYAYSRADEAVIEPVAVVSNCGPTNLADPNYWSPDNSDISNNDVATLLSWATGLNVTEGNYAQYTTELQAVSPIGYIDTAVPTVIAHGAVDKMVPPSNATTLATKLFEAGIRYDYVTFPNSGHGLDSDPDCTQKVNELMLEYAKAYLPAIEVPETV